MDWLITFHIGVECWWKFQADSRAEAETKGLEKYRKSKWATQNPSPNYSLEQLSQPNAHGDIGPLGRD